MRVRSFTEFIKGLSIRGFRPALYAWFFNLVFALFVYWAYLKVFVNAAGDSVIAGDVSEVGVFTLLSDIAQNHDGSLSLAFYVALVAALFYFLASIFLAGGIYSVMVGHERPTLGNLAASSVENFFGMFKLFLLNMLNWLAAIIFTGIFLVIVKFSPSLYENEGFIRVFTYGWAAFAALVFTFSTAIYDFSRVFKLKEERGIFNAFKKGIRFTFSNKLNVLVLFLLYALSLLILYLLYSVFSGLTGRLVYVSLLFISYQLFMLVRYYLKMAVMQAEVTLAEY
jgi:hypothetical protein